MDERQSRLDGEMDRVRGHLATLRALIDGLEMLVSDPLPPGAFAAQSVAHAAGDLAMAVARLDTYRRCMRDQA